MLERVRALLAKAASTNFPAEAETFRAKADALMTAFAIEAWQVEVAQNGAEGRPTPIRRDVDFDWWRGGDTPFRSALWALFLDTASHCRCAVVRSKLTRVHEAGGSRMVMPVLGCQPTSTTSTCCSLS